MTQHLDDLPCHLRAAIGLIRAEFSDDDTTADLWNRQLCQCPGRAAGKVSTWSLARAADVLRRHARRSVRLGASNMLTPHEQSLLAVINALISDDTAAAIAAAGWLVTPEGASRLVERLAPAARSFKLAA